MLLRHCFITVAALLLAACASTRTQPDAAPWPEDMQAQFERFNRSDMTSVITPYLSLKDQLMQVGEGADCSSYADTARQAIALNPTSLIAHSMLLTCIEPGTPDFITHEARVRRVIEHMTQASGSIDDPVHVREVDEIEVLLLALGFTVSERELRRTPTEIRYLYYARDESGFVREFYFSNHDFLVSMARQHYPDLDDRTVTNGSLEEIGKMESPMGKLFEANRALAAGNTEKTADLLASFDEKSNVRTLLEEELQFREEPSGAGNNTDLLRELANAGYTRAVMLYLHLMLVLEGPDFLNEQAPAYFAQINAFTQVGEGEFRLGNRLLQYADEWRAIGWQLVEAAAANGHNGALFRLGERYQFGYDAETDPALALSYFQSASEQGYAAATGKLGYFYHQGLGVKRDVTQAADYYLRAIEEGVVWPAPLLAAIYESDELGAVNGEQARHWYRYGALRGNTLAQNDYGRVLMQGVGGAEQPDKAPQWFSRAAIAGDATGARNLGLCYQYGSGVDTSITEALRWFKQAYALGGRDAALDMGKIYTNNDAYRDYEKALFWLHRAEAAGFEDADIFLAQIYGDSGYDGYNVQRSLEYLERMAKRNIASAHGDLARNYYHNSAVRDLYLARAWASSGALLNDPESLFYLGVIAEEVDSDNRAAFDWYRRASELDHAIATYNVGVYFEGEYGIPLDAPMARRYYEKAFELGEWAAATNIGFMYERGLFGEVNDREASIWYQKAVDKNDPKGMVHLAFFKFNGHGGFEIDQEAGYQLATRARALGNNAADLLIGKYLYIQDQYSESIPYLESAVEQEYAEAHLYLGDIFHHQVEEPDMDRAIEHYLESLPYEHFESFYRLARIYWNGVHVAEDRERALRYFDKAATLYAAEGHTKSKYGHLGNIFFSGDGISKDYQLAEQFFLKALPDGRRFVYNNLAEIYRYGYTGKTDINTAIDYYKRAAELGSVIAMYNLGITYSDGEYVPVDKEAAFYWTNRSAEGGDSDAMAMLSDFYREGLGVEKNLNEAERWMQQAIEAGYEKDKDPRIYNHHEG